MGDLIAALGCVDFLADRPPELVAEFMSNGRPMDLPRGHVFWRPGQRPQGIVVPVTGELASVKSDSAGHELCYELVGPGECAGVPCALDGLPHPDEVRAIRAGAFFAMERSVFLQFLSRRPDVHRAASATVGRLLRRSLLERDRMAFLSVNARLARFLLERTCVRASDGARILLRATHAELAPRVGSVREVVARACSRFVERGLMRRTRHALFVVDRAGLSEEACLDAGEPADRLLASDAAARTRRFFLPALGDGAALASETAACAETVAGFATCLDRGCPVAAARRAVTSPGPVVRPRNRASAPRPDPERRIPDAAPSRTAAEGRAVERRVAAYRARAASIESTFGGEERVPATCSVFRDLARTGA